MKIKTGLVGYGLGGRSFHAPFITALPDLYELVYVVERRSNLSQEKYPWVKVARTFDELLADDSIDLIVITTPNETHFPFAKQSLEAGKHVVLDKPMTVSGNDALRLIELSHQTKKIFSVYQNRRYASDFLAIRKLLDKKLLGSVHEFEAQYNRYRPEIRDSWKETTSGGSGILYDLGPHLIDQAFCLFGIPESITADIRRQRPGTQTDDYFDIRLDFGYTKAILKAGMLVREQGPRYMIHGTRGSFIKYGDDPQDVDLRAGKSPADPAWGKEPEEQYGLLHTEADGKVIKERVPSEAGNFGIYYANLYETLVHRAALKEKPEHGYNVVRIIELALESSRRRCTLPCSNLLKVSY